MLSLNYPKDFFLVQVNSLLSHKCPYFPPLTTQNNQKHVDERDQNHRRAVATGDFPAG